MSIRVATFNVNGIRARLPVLLNWLAKSRPDVLCMQEIKCLDDQFPVDALKEAGYCCAVRGQRSFNGVAILTRDEASEIQVGFNDGEPDAEARLISVLAHGIHVVNTYIPQGRDPSLPAFKHKLEFFARLRRWFEAKFDPQTPIIWLGDINVAPEAIDVYDPRRMDGKVGFHPDERQALSETLSWGFVDLFRMHHPDKRQFSFWDYRLPKAFERNLGWRIDHILATAPLSKVCTACEIDPEPRGMPVPSDHTPVWAEFDLA